MHHSREGLLAVNFSVLIFGLTALFSKLIVLSALEITLLRSVFAAFVLLGYIRWLGESLRLANPRNYAVAALLGVLLASHWVTYFHAMQVASVAVGVIALYTFPIITVFLEPLFRILCLPIAYYTSRPRPRVLLPASRWFMQHCLLPCC